MGTTKMGTTKKSATKPNKRFRGGGKSRMASRLLRSKLKMKTMAPLAPKHVIPRMVMSRLAKEIMSHLPGATLDDPNKLSLVAADALHTAAEGFLVDVLSCSYALARHANRTVLMDSDIKCICMAMRTLNKTTFGDDGFHAKLKGVLADTRAEAGSANNGTDSDGTYSEDIDSDGTDGEDIDSDDTDSEASQSTPMGNGMNIGLQRNEIPAPHDNASSTSNLTDGDNHRTKRRIVILRVGPKNLHAALGGTAQNT